MTSLPLAAAALVALLSAGCHGRRSHAACAYESGGYAQSGAYREVPVTYSAEGGYYEATVPESAQTVYIVLGEPPGDVQPVAAPAPRPRLRPRPVEVAAEPLPPENPFAATRTWTGKYVCTQGLTDLTLRVTSVRGPRVDAVVEFSHEESGASGSYRMSGRFDPRSRSVTFDPGAWIEHPRNYITVSIEGRVSLDGSRFSGRIPHRGCSWFKLRAAK